MLHSNSQKPQSSHRLYNLDYLRGLAAFGIMLYHFLIWSSGRGFTAETFMGRLGVYGVSIFYILSGLTLFHVYFFKFEYTKKSILDFFKKRILRIFPLLWLVTFISIFIFNRSPDWFDLILNLTGLFGFFKWDIYFSAGVWSIGNEMVFYFLFPFFVFFTKNYRPIMIIAVLVILGLYIYFAFDILNPDLKLSDQWKNYVNPLNQAFLFLSGFLIGYFFNKKSFTNLVAILAILAGMVLFVFFPVEGDLAQLVTGANRLIFTASCLLICFGFYKLTFQFPYFVHKPLTILGESSYSVYLLHPIVWSSLSFIFKWLNKRSIDLPDPYQFIIKIISTLIISYLVYLNFEKYFMKIGRKPNFS